MSIKKLFDSGDTSRNFLADATEKEAFQEIESADNLRALKDKQDSFVPHINYRNPANFAKFGSAYLYYKAAIERIIDFYPYDGSDAEINEFYNKSLNIEKYIFNNLYPRTNGFIKISSDGWGTLSGSLQSGYGLPSSLEYIDFTGGPHTISETATTKLFHNPSSSNPQASNIYDTSIYTAAGLPSDYGSGTRQSNLRANFDTGVSVEFWIKSGSMSTALTNKQVVVDLWNNELSSSGYGGADGANPNPHYGRITIALNGLSSGSPFRITAQSGATGIFEQTIGNDLKVNTLDNWKHYAIVMQNTGSDFAYRLYVDGRINDINYVSSLNINEINSKNMVGRLGSLLTAPSGAGGIAQEVLNMVGAGKFSGSIDELRYWKIARSGKGIGKNWFTQVRGGTNTDIANTTLGIYYKFNEGVTGESDIDQTILDYSGRVSNGDWTNYTANGRFTGSAIVEATASTTEYKDPIIYAVNPDVSSLKKSLLKSGSYHDTTNNSSFISLIPNWIIEEVEEDETNNVRVISHIMGSYFDKIHAWISAIPKFKNTVYTSASYTPYPFAEHLPQSLGLYVPELFVEADVLEKFLNRDDTTKFAGDLTETKNLIYLNLYNNIANIYKAKGTEKSVRNIFRCFYMDDTVMRLNTYAHHNTFTLQNNLKQVRVNQTSLNFNSKLNLTGVVYQAQSGSSAESQGYISGSGPLGYEDKYGFTLEADILFPRFFREKDKFDRNFFTASLFGLYSASVDPDLNNDTTFYSTDNVNFQVYAVRDTPHSKNVYFKLSSSLGPFPFPTLTSSVFFNTYDQERWNISVRLKPSNYPLTDIVTGSEGYTYDLVFRGANPELGSVQNNFVLTASLSKAAGRNMLRSAKRAYVGARKTNITGAILNKCDVVFNGLRYWTKYLEDATLNQHIFDVHNRGISGSYQNYAVKDPTLANNDVLNLNALALDWSFDDITGSNTTGNFYVTDFSSGSALLRDNFKWVGGITGYQHTGYGSGFPTSSSDAVSTEAINSFKFVDPEMVISSEMVKILSQDDIVFDITETVPSFRYTLEKSMYNAISEEILQFFAGVIDFNNVIGDPVNRYRARYKTLEKLREIFFRRVTTTSKVEKFIDYYKWFDDAISQVIEQMLPASSDFLPDTLNTIESHVLERNKYKSAFPTIEMKPTDPEGIIEGVYALTYPYVTGSTPLPSSPRLTSEHKIYWQQRAERGAPEITSGDNTVDQQRNKFRDVIYNTPHLSQSYPVVSTIDGTRYSTRKFTLDRLAKTHQINTIHQSASYAQGGVNFGGNKNIQLTYNALYPFGPVNTTSEIYIPENILVSFTDDMVKLDETVDIADVNIASASYFFKHLQKHKRYMGVQHGREWEEGLGYYNLKSSRIFPFNIISPGVNSGFNKRVVDLVTASIQLTNLHNDVYGDDMEVPMQGPFTNYAVGGHQSRHIAVNKSSSAKTYYVSGLDSYLSRPEAWKILLGKCFDADSDGSSIGSSGAIGMVGADYPWPEANAEGVRPYPMTGAQRATYYRDFIAKRPVNIRNIQMKTGSTILGNYTHNYELVSSVGAYSNPRNFVENQPTLPIEITETPSASQGRLFTDIHRTENGHIELIPSYSIGYLTGATNKSIITSRFSNPGGIETMGIGYMDIRAAEYSVYNVPNYRNLTVLKPSQGPSGTISQPTGSGTPGIRVYDIMGKDYGLYSHLARHTARFGRDPIFCLLPGKTYNQLPNFHKVNRNTKYRLTRKSGSRFGVATTSSVYDNWYVQYQIPRSDKQYAWITESLSDPTNERYMGFSPLYGDLEGWYSSSTGYVSFFDFVSASEIGNPLPNLYQPTTSRLNIFTLDYVSGSTNNIIGFPAGTNTSSYYNNTLLKKVPLAVSASVISKKASTIRPAGRANYFNLLMTRRGNTFGWGWNSSRQEDNPILRAERKANEITLMQEDRTLYRYSMRPVNSDGRPSLININAPISEGSQTKQEDNNFTLKVAHKGLDVRFSDTGMDDFLSAQNIQTQATPLEQIIQLTYEPRYTLNWLLYIENLFPSIKNAYKSSSIERLDYDNKFWRDNLTARVSLGATVRNSYNLNPYAHLSQSCWPLDAQEDFLTRTGPPTGSEPGEFIFPTEGKAGELQNNYFSYFTGALPRVGAPVTYQAVRMLRPAALYSKKHMITTLRSPVSPTGPKPIVSYDVDAQTFSGAIAPYAGEAKWEANTLAGIVVKNVKKAAFQASGSDPFFNDYDDFKYDLKLIAKDYSIIPEFRISEHVEDYVKFGISNKEKTDTFEIPGTLHNSSTSSFYKDYSNSEFMTEFLNIKDQTDLKGAEIKLICSAAIRLNPYKGFYPAQRTLDLVSQFSSSYGESLYGRAPNAAGNLATYGFPKFLLPAQPAGALRPIVQPLFNPGILYNAIKSGIAVDYPVVTDITKIARAKTDGSDVNYYGVDVGNKTDNWAITSANSASATRGTGYIPTVGSGSVFWDKRIPFEAIMEPENYLDGLDICDIEPHPSMSLDATGSWSGGGDEVYTLMAKNFFGEVANFFLKDQALTRLESGVITAGTTFQSGSMYGARLKIRRSVAGPRTYDYESGSSGDNTAYSRMGGRVWGDTLGGNFKLASFPLPQDPRQNPFFKENFTMYSRPSAFGPAVGGRPVASDASKVAALAPRQQVLKASPVDSFNGFNWAFTPPYYNGEAWVDIIFKPQARTSYDLDSILSEVKTFYRRVDPGWNGMVKGPYADNQTALLSSFVTFSGSLQTIYSGHNVNWNAMQISSSINIFGVQSVPQQRTGRSGQLVESVNTSEGKKWIIQPKWETPMLNFNDTGTRAITSSAGTLTLPSNYGTGSVPQGMWHQFGIMDPDPKKGVFLEISDIPVDWLKFHYDILQNDTYYNDFDAVNKGARVNKRMKSLLDVVGFNKKNSRVRLGQMSEEIILREAVVAIPYILESVDNNTNNNAAESSNTTKKSFIDIPMARYEAALAGQQGSLTGDSLDASGDSIRKLVQKMNRYILPPQFDFVNNGDVDPIVMYMFEFQYKLDKDDLAYIWQNLAPRNYKRLDLVSESIAHDLGNTQLLSEENIFDNENLRWMLFKVKQRSQANYDDLIADQAESSTTVARMNAQGINALTTGLGGGGGSIGGGGGGSIGGGIGGSAISGMSGQSSNQSKNTPQASTEPAPEGYPIAFNWPYDYISFVEMVKFDVQILFKDEEETGDVIEGQGPQG